MLACVLDPGRFEIAVYERNAAPGRKFLVAGDGGLNLTHSEDLSTFVTRYTPPDFLEKALRHFSNQDLVQWLKELGIETYTGSSGRVFPLAGIKPVEVLNAVLAKMKKNQATLHTRHIFKDFSEQELVFETEGASRIVKSELVVFCLGGASWPVTGSTGEWTESFKKNGIRLNPFHASNCAYRAEWPESLLRKAEGRALKNIVTTCGTASHAGEIVLTRFGLEGSGIYPLSPQIRMQLEQQGRAELWIDLKPALSPARLLQKLQERPAARNLSAHLKTELRLSEAQLTLLKHCLSKEDFLDAAALARHIKHFRLTVTGTGPVEEAISTTGGVDRREINENFELRNKPGHFVIGEMLDYDAPTGGYLLQSCFSMANYLACHLNTM